MKYLKVKQVAELLGITTSAVKLKFTHDPNIRKVRTGLPWLYLTEDIMRVKAERDSRKICKCCEKHFSNLENPDEAWCKRPACRAHKKTWCQANFDLLPEENKFRNKYEAEFWEVTPEQKEYYASFFALMRPPVPQKKRKCLGCGEDLTSFKMQSRGARICADCHVKIAKIGALAVV